MNLPILHPLREDESTYIAFTKGLLDLDKAISNDTEYYFSKMVALNLPVWKEDNTGKEKFIIDLSSVGGPSSLNSNPNVSIPMTIRCYMENIIRQDITEAGANSPVEEVVELAFYKMLNKMGLSKERILESITFINEIVTSNFISTESNNGWGEIICQIPNRCRELQLVTREVPNVKNEINTDDEDVEVAGQPNPLYDNGNKQYMMTDFKSVIDFDNCRFIDDGEPKEFKFNTLLLFYRDKSGVDKLHGINFIYPFENKATYWDQITFTQKTNTTRNIGYQFLFNLKTCNNNASKQEIFVHNEHAMWWDGFGATMSSLNSFLETKMREEKTERALIDDITYNI